MQRRKLYGLAILSVMILGVLCYSFVTREIVEFKAVKSQLADFYGEKEDIIYNRISDVESKLSRSLLSDGVKFLLVNLTAKYLVDNLQPNEYRSFYLLDEKYFVDTWDVVYNAVDYNTIRVPTREETYGEYYKITSGILGIYFNASKAIVYYLTNLIGLSFLSLLPSLFLFVLSAFSSSLVLKYAVITLSITCFCFILSTKRANAQESDKPVNILKLNTATDGQENKYTFGLIHLKRKIGILGMLPQKNGMEFGLGPNKWFSNRFGSGFIFNPISVTTAKNEKGLVLADCHLWNIVSLKIKKIAFVSMSFFSQPLVSKRDKIFYSKNQFTRGSWGARIESTWKKRWQHLIGLVYSYQLHEKINLQFFANLIQPYSLKVEFSASL